MPFIYVVFLFDYKGFGLIRDGYLARKGDSLVKGNVAKRQKDCALQRAARAPSGKDEARNKEWQSSKKTSKISFCDV